MNTGESFSGKNGNHFHRYLEYASSILTRYKGEEPFHLYLKKYFLANKKHGSGDRKQITSLCYDYFRVCFGINEELTLSDKLLLGIFLIEKNSISFLEKINPTWNKNISLNISEKIKMVENVFNAEKIFPLPNELSKEVNFQKFSLSFLIQPKLFIRIRPGYKNVVFDKLQSANIIFEKINNHCLSFANNEKVSDILNIDKEAVIQDYNSQNTLNSFTFHFKNQTSAISVWDCCAGSGGKSILANDLLKNIDLTVSDTRKDILENLKKRFAKAGIKNYHSVIADLSISSTLEGIKGRPPFALIIADVPCSGSGTWSRTPEQLSFFSEENIKMYSDLQKKIVANAVKHLNKNGYLLYITCSVFKKENEDVVDFIRENLHLELIDSNYLKGYEMQADTLFAALLIKSPIVT